MAGKWRKKLDHSYVINVLSQNMDQAQHLVSYTDYPYEAPDGLFHVNGEASKIVTGTAPGPFNQSNTPWPTPADFEAIFEPVPADAPAPPVTQPPAPPTTTPAPPVNSPPVPGPGAPPAATVVPTRIQLFRKKSDPDVVVAVLFNDTDQAIQVGPGQRLMVELSGASEVMNDVGIAVTWEPLPAS